MNPYEKDGPTTLHAYERDLKPRAPEKTWSLSFNLPFLNKVDVLRGEFANSCC